MTRRALIILATLALAGCSSEGKTGLMGGLPIKALAQATLAQIGLGKKTAPAAPVAAPDAAQVAASRKLLENAGNPLYIIQDKALNLAAYFGKLGQNGDVVTWSTPEYTSVSLRDGMVVATRGFGPDIMSSSGPTTAQVAQGTGTTSRSYDYLDAADQIQTYRFDCTLSRVGAEKITLIGRDYATRRVDESCTGPKGTFTNSYWFDQQAKLRQSSQLLVPGIENLLLQRIID